MRKIALAYFMCFFTAAAIAQPVTSLHENFDAACAVSTGNPSDWNKYNPVTGTAPSGAWTCTSNYGRPSSTGSPTPGMVCTNIYGSGTTSAHLDTSFLITPLLNLSSYTPNHIYLRFDTKVTNLAVGDTLHVIEAGAADSTFSNPPLDSDLTDAANPVIGPGDVTNWVTHEIDITPLESVGDFYIGFRFTANATNGCTWYIDNVNTSTTRLYTGQIDRKYIPMTVIGQSTTSKIEIGFSASDARNYQIWVFDMIGKPIYTGSIDSKGGFETYTIGGLNLPPGMYCIRMGDGVNYGYTKTIVQ